jgi:ubiquinone/menaquinone biosynthesis C-methylase UbiE
LEVAIGTGRNLPFYPRGLQLTAIDFSPAMLDIARDRAAALGIDVALIEADAQHLPFADDQFDAVVCTLALSSIPDPAAAINEMHRVLRAGGQLLVVEHVASPYRVVRAGQRRLERLSVRLAGDHQTRQPYPAIVAAGFTIDRHERLERASSSASARSSPPTGE